MKISLVAAALSGASLPAPASSPAPVVLSTEVNAAPQAVWDAWTSEAGAKTFFAPKARVERRIGGAYEIYFLPDRPEGLRGSEGATLLALEPPRRLMFSWNAPESFGPLRSQLTVVDVRVEPLGSAASKVTLTHTGWGEGAEWQKVRDYFAGAWPTVLERLRHSYQPKER